MPMQKQKILDCEEVMEDMRRMFKEQTTLNNSTLLSQEGVKALIIKAGHELVTEDEVESIFKEMDRDMNGYVDIDEFMTFIMIADKFNTQEPKAKDAVFNIRKARLKLNETDLLEMFETMPLSF